MEYILEAIEHALETDTIYPAFLTALTVPDVCGAAAYDGLPGPDRYVRWYTDWPGRIFPHVNIADGYTVYALRCRLLHEGSLQMGDVKALRKSVETPNLRAVRVRLDRNGLDHQVARSFPSASVGVVDDEDAALTGIAPGSRVMTIDLLQLPQLESTYEVQADSFCRKTVRSAREWLKSIEGDEIVRNRLARSVRLSVEGEHGDERILVFDPEPEID